MAVDLVIGQGQTLPPLSQTIIDPTTSNAANLTGASVTFVMRGTGTPSPTVTAAATIPTPSAGLVTYDWTAANTATPGLYNAQFLVTTSSGSTYQWPATGYLQVEVQESLSGAPQRLVEITDAKDVLNLQSADRIHDTKILRWIDGLRPVVESITGPIIQTTYEEWHDGGQYYVTPRRSASTGYGTSPVFILNACSFYIGPIEYQAVIVPSPDEGTIYSVMADTFNRVVRRGPGGGLIPFPNVLQSVHLWYTAGQNSVPTNVYEATLELLRVNYQRTQQSTRRGGPSPAEEIMGPPVGYFVPNRVREMLSPTRRAPSIY